MPMTRLQPGSTTFLLTCHDCHGTLKVHTHPDDSTGFAAARLAATQRAWSFIKGLDRCGRCTRAATREPARPSRKR